jgi:translation initiation factor 1A
MESSPEKKKCGRLGVLYSTSIVSPCTNDVYVREYQGIANHKTNNKAKRSNRRGSQEKGRRELICKEDGQQYAEVQKALGNGRFIMQCYDDISRIGKIRGKDYRRMWIGVGDLILISLRDFDDSKADVIHKYSTEEARSLQVPMIFEVKKKYACMNRI